MTSLSKGTKYMFGDWTTLNPTAPAFEPKRNKNEGNKVINSSTDIKAHTSASTSKTNSKKRVDKSKPSVLTLEEFIVEKLKIESSPKKESNHTNDKNIKKWRKVENFSVAHNSLDSSAPTRKRGKEREVPKPKKPTALKKIIINEKNDKILNNEQSFQTNVNLEELNKTLLHNKTYREYCDQRLTPTIDQLVIALLSDLVLFQDRMYLRDPIKAKVKKRLCFGFKEVTKYTKINKTKLLVIAPDIEKIESKGGLDDYLSTLITICQINTIPIIFSLNRRLLGITSKKKGYISCVGVLNYDGSQDNFKQLLSLSQSERNEYKAVFEESLSHLKTLSEEGVRKIIDGLPNIPKQFSQFSEALSPSGKRGFKLKQTNSH